MFFSVVIDLDSNEPLVLRLTATIRNDITRGTKPMKIALIGSLNACCGVAAHAQLLAEALQRGDHRLKVLAPLCYEDDGTRLLHAPDQPNVARCYSFLRYGDRETDERLRGPSTLMRARWWRTASTW